MTEMKKPTPVFSQKEKDIAISILNGMSISKCSGKFELTKVRCQTVLNTFCMKSNHLLYAKLQQAPFSSVPNKKLREHSEIFIEDSKKIVNVTVDSSIWVLPGVPAMTLKAIWQRNNYTIKDLLKHSEQKLLRFPCLGKIGLSKLVSSLSRYGFTIKEN